MYSFSNDYNETAHPQVLDAFMRTTTTKNGGYGLDSYSDKARTIIGQLIGNSTADIHFFPGGTITNLTFISHVLRPHQAVIAAETGHVAVHETGAIEATGHKVIIATAADGKLTPELIQAVLIAHQDEHMVQPKLVYISNTTELGTIYTKQELQALSQYCKAQQLYLYLDGARLAMALTADENDLSFQDIASLTDAFYIGGTKVGAFAGEALIILNENLKSDFRFTLKQKGGMLAKGWVLGVQFIALLEQNQEQKLEQTPGQTQQPNLYLELGRHSNQMANKLQQLFVQYGFDFSIAPQTNQIFVNIPDGLVDIVTQHYAVYPCGTPKSGFTCLRFCTAWSTTIENIQRLELNLQNWLK